MKRKLLIASAIVTTAIGGIAVASAVAPHGMMRADTNGDGIVSRSEFFTMAESHFKKLDSNANGKIDATELHGPRMARLDSNGDGVLTRDEFAAGENAHFKQLDANTDQKITEAELMAEHDRHRAERGERLGGWRGGPGMNRGPGGPGGMLAHLDSDHDGKLSRAEYDAPFVKMDSNADGFVDAGERRAMMQAMRAEFEKRGGDWDHGAMPPPPPAPPALDTGQ